MEYKKIRNIEIGDFVQGETEVNQVLDKYEYNLDSRLLFSINKGPFFVTECHPFKTIDGWKAINPELGKSNHLMEEEVSALKVGDTLICFDKEVKVDSIDFKASEELKVYDLQLTGDKTYYADGYLVHNKGMKGNNTKWYDGIAIRDSVVKPWNRKVNDTTAEAEEDMALLQRDFFGAFTEGEETEETGGGQALAAQQKLDEAVAEFGNKRTEAKMTQQSAFKTVGAQFKKQNAELSAMIGKTNLAGAAERQKQEMQVEATKSTSDVTEIKDVSVTQAGEALDRKKEQYGAEMADLQTKYDTAIAGMRRAIDDNVNPDEFRSDYNSEKGGKDKSYRYNSAGKIESEGYTTPVNVEYDLIDFDSFLTNPENPTVTRETHPTFTVDNIQFNNKGSYFGTIRAKDGNQTCFIGSTKILMGGSDE